jgi:predicted ester cyclase
MSENTPVGTIRSAVSALNAGDLDGYLGHFDPTCPRWIPGVEQPMSLADIADSLRQLHAGFEGLHLHEDALFGDGRHACARWRLVGRHVGDVYGLPATGQLIDVPTCEVYEVTDGRVVNSWVYGNPGGIFEQIQHGAGVDR